MTIEAALETRLHGLADVETASGGRIGWSQRLRGLSSITLQIIADPRPQHLRGFQRVRATDVQVDIWAASNDAACALRDAVIAGMVPPARVGDIQFQRAQVARVRGGAVQDQPAGATRLPGEVFRQSIDFVFIHNG